LAIVGPETAAFFENIRADKLLMGVDGIHIRGGVMVPDLNEAHTKRAMANSAKEVIVVADHSKLGRSTLGTIVPLAKVTQIITGREADTRLLAEVRVHVPVTAV
jgi:DeoR family fructose operon transcriptional repressor